MFEHKENPHRRAGSSKPRAASHSPHRSDDGCAFLPDPTEGAPARADEPLGEMLAEEFLASATAGEETIEDDRGEMEIEELGGPFTRSTADEEFAYGTDDSNPANAKPEAFPTTTHPVRP